MSVCEENPYIVCGEGGYKCSHMLDGPPDQVITVAIKSTLGIYASKIAYCLVLNKKIGIMIRNIIKNAIKPNITFEIFVLYLCF